MIGTFERSLIFMSDRIKTLLSWSSGKDAALTLYYLRQDHQYDVQALLTSVNKHHDRVSMHGLRRSLLEQQVEALSIPAVTVELPEQPDMQQYEREMETAFRQFRDSGITHAAFGDIFLEDLRAYREQQLQEIGLHGVFPIWKRDSKELVCEFLDLGFRAVVVCVNAGSLDESFVGRDIDQSFLDDLPEGVDPCGENGEFHTFCYDGPIFNKPVEFDLGEKVYREYESPSASQNKDRIGFWFCDLLPAAGD